MSRKRKKKGKQMQNTKTTPKFKVSAPSLIAKTEALFTREQQTAPIVQYTNRAWQKMKKVIAMCTEEVGWLGTVDKVGVGYLVTDIFVPKQVVTATECDIEADALADLVHELDYPENLYYWGHSHVNMGVSPSGQDEQQTSEYLEHNDIFIRAIYNKKGASKVDVFDMVAGIQYQSVANGMRVEPIPDAEMEEFIAGVKVNVCKPPPRTFGNANSVGSPTGTTGGKTTSARDNFQAPSKCNVSTMFENPFIELGER